VTAAASTPRTDEVARLQDQVTDMARRIRRGEERRKALLHILVDYEQDRRRLLQQAERLDNSRRALLHILQDSQHARLRLEESRKAMIHIMGDLRDTTEAIQGREQELRDKQEQLVQAAKLATLGELTTGVAHELNNPLNNIGLFIGNVMDMIQLEPQDSDRMLADLRKALDQVHKAGQIITHLRTFGRTAPASREPVHVNAIIVQALSLLHEQLRIHEVEVQLDIAPEDPVVMGNAIQLEQVFLNLLTNARDALREAARKVISITNCVEDTTLRIVFQDSGPGIPQELEHRVFDPFFTTKEVGEGTGLGLSITYGIIRDHSGTIQVHSSPGTGAAFVIELPIREDSKAEVAA
jgi:C4-dicarboxylate-specific signal transduction histidine kinase